MAKATMKVEFNNGCSIKSAFDEAIRLASVLKIWVEFDFNGVTCLADENSNAEFGERNYKTVLANKKRTQFAFGG